MNKKYIVRLNDQEHEELSGIVKKLSGTCQKVSRGAMTCFSLTLAPTSASYASDKPG